MVLTAFITARLGEPVIEIGLPYLFAGDPIMISVVKKTNFW